MNKDIFINTTPGTKLFFLLFAAFLGFILTVFLVSITNTFFTPQDELYPITYYRIIQIIQATCLFITPSLVFAIFFNTNPHGYLIQNKLTYKILLLSILLIIVIIPFSEFLGSINQQIPFPEHINKIIKEMEDNSEKIVNLLLADKTPTGIFLNYLIIAALAALAEELFFRGCLQQIITGITKNAHAAVWISAIIFSAIHFEFYGFLPRTLLGAILGYIFLWTGNIKASIIVHFLYNSLIITFQLFFKDSIFIQNLQLNDYILVCISLAASYTIVYMISKEIKLAKVKT